MYYSSGNYEAFAHPEKPQGIEQKSAYLVGSGLGALSAAVFLVRDAQMPGDHIHILEKDPTAGGACDGLLYDRVGYVMRRRLRGRCDYRMHCNSGPDSCSGFRSTICACRSGCNRFCGTGRRSGKHSFPCGGNRILSVYPHCGRIHHTDRTLCHAGRGSPQRMPGQPSARSCGCLL